MLSMDYITSKRMYEIEERASKIGMSRLLMMENAGSYVARYIVENMDINNKSIVAIAGTGNNGGDTFVAARHLARYTKPIVILLGNKEDIRTEEAKLNFGILENMTKSITLIKTKEVSKEVSDAIAKADIILDGIFGIGIKGKIREPYSSVIDLINNSRAYKVAIDIPSGLDPDTGEIMDKAVKADITITFHKAKYGLKNPYAGKVIVCHIGIPPEAEE